MAERSDFSLRPVPAESPEGAFRVYLTSSDLSSLALKPGQLCLLKNTDGLTGAAVAWRSTDPGTNRGIAKVTHFLKDAYGFKFKEPIFIEPGGHWQRVDRITLRATEPSQANPIDRTECELPARWALYRLEVVRQGLTFEISPRRARKRQFSIEQIEPVPQNGGTPFLYAFFPDTLIEFAEDSIPKAKQETHQGPLQIQEHAIGGLSYQIQQLNDYLKNIESGHMPQFSPGLPRGILLHGPQGVGKSLLLDKLSEAPWRKIVRIASPINKSIITNTFKEALENQPSAIILDDLEVLAGSHERESPSQNHIASILTQAIDGLGGQNVLVIGAARHLDGVHPSLRTATRLWEDIYIPAPNIQARKDILKIFACRMLERGMISSDLLEQIGEETPGYTGDDLIRLLKKAEHSATTRMERTRRLRRELEQREDKSSRAEVMDSTRNPEVDESADELRLTAEDFDAAKRSARPSTMWGATLEAPNVKWSDIAGLEEVQAQIRQLIEWPFKRAKGMARMGLKSHTGILLYGPPGCSKTLIAKALASEGKLNFLSVKGAELVSKYVGDSERAIRDVFRRAKSASPSIIFFDEIDSIAAARDSSSHTNGLNVITTLLTEMDGLEVLKDVLVLAATNKPEILDSAIMRPGRFDAKLYIGPPGYAGRRQLFEMNTPGEVKNADVDVDVLAAKTEGHSGAEIVQICQMAARFALRDGSDETAMICQTHFEQALEIVPPEITPHVREKFETWATKQGK